MHSRPDGTAVAVCLVIFSKRLSYCLRVGANRLIEYSSVAGICGAALDVDFFNESLSTSHFWHKRGSRLCSCFPFLARSWRYLDRTSYEVGRQAGWGTTGPSLDPTRIQQPNTNRDVFYRTQVARGTGCGVLCATEIDLRL